MSEIRKLADDLARVRLEQEQEQQAQTEARRRIVAQRVGEFTTLMARYGIDPIPVYTSGPHEPIYGMTGRFSRQQGIIGYRAELTKLNESGWYVGPYVRSRTDSHHLCILEDGSTIQVSRAIPIEQKKLLGVPVPPMPVGGYRSPTGAPTTYAGIQENDHHFFLNVGEPPKSFTWASDEGLFLLSSAYRRYTE